ncbi:MAG: hypothetical protein LBB22_01570 [Treponema sp.]|nr:hypothetical protein [Treponema sp.]
MKRQLKNWFIIFVGIVSFIFLSCVKRTNEIDTEKKNELNITLKIKEIEEEIIQNITDYNDIDNEIDTDEIISIMDGYELQSNSCIVKINDRNYDLLIVGNLLKSYNNIKTIWDNISKENIQRLTTEYVTAKIEKQEMDDYALTNALLYYSYQAETAAAFFPYLLEQFQLTNGQYNAGELPEISIDLPPLSMTAINIDGIHYNAVAVETLQSLMEQKTDALKQKTCNELTNEINTQFAICVGNVDAYLDWYYGFTTGLGKTWETIKGALDPNKTAAEAVREFMITNYTGKIGNGTNFKNMLNILQYNRDETIYLALVFTSTLENCILEPSPLIETTQDITGDDYMSSFIELSDYLNKVVSEGLPVMGMGNKLDTDGILALDIANLVVNFIPGVGFIAGIGLDYLTLKLTEHWKRPEFKEQIISSILDTKKNLLEIVRVENIGGGNEIVH